MFINKAIIFSVEKVLKHLKMDYFGHLMHTSGDNVIFCCLCGAMSNFGCLQCPSVTTARNALSQGERYKLLPVVWLLETFLRLLSTSKQGAQLHTRTQPYQLSNAITPSVSTAACPYGA